MMLNLGCMMTSLANEIGIFSCADAQARQGFALEQVSRAASQAGEAAMSMPGDCHI